MTNLKRVNLTEVDLTEVDLMGAYLTYADLYRVNLMGANLMGADLTNANLEEANLTNANMEKANLYMANLKGALLTGASFKEGTAYGYAIGGYDGGYFWWAVLLQNREVLLQYGCVRHTLRWWRQQGPHLSKHYGHPSSHWQEGPAVAIAAAEVLGDTMTEWEPSLKALREEYGITEDQLESLNGVWNLIQVKSQVFAKPPECDIGDDVITLTWSFEGTLAFIDIQKDGRMNWFFDSPLTKKSRSRLERTIPMSEAGVFVGLLDDFFRS